METPRQHRQKTNHGRQRSIEQPCCSTFTSLQHCAVPWCDIFIQLFHSTLRLSFKPHHRSFHTLRLSFKPHHRAFAMQPTICHSPYSAGQLFYRDTPALLRHSRTIPYSCPLVLLKTFSLAHILSDPFRLP